MFLLWRQGGNYEETIPGSDAYVLKLDFWKKVKMEGISLRFP